MLSISVGPVASLGCVDLCNALIKLRSEWEAETLKVVMTDSAEDGPEWQKHIGNKQRRRDLANQFKDAKNPFKIVIVRDMWPAQMMNAEFGMTNGLNFETRPSAFALSQGHRRDAGETRHRL
jgi:hypothetical protein